jgi:hypothetical protein
MLLAFAILSPCSASAAEKWVHGSWVNVRETVEAQSAVIEHVTTNTKVNVVAEQGKTCEIVWSEAKRGFVPCGLLGEKALTLKEVEDAPFAPTEASRHLEETLKHNPKYSALRAFWIAPSVARLFTAGIYFQRTLLSEKQWNLENGIKENGEHFDDPPPKLVRYPVPEFEAMKALLAKGIVAQVDMDFLFSRCPQTQQTQTRQTDKSMTNDLQERLSIAGCQIPEIPELRLPNIRASFFKNSKNILPGNADIRQISAHIGIVGRGMVIKGPHWGCNHDADCFWVGGWDIGVYDLRLDKPIVEHVIGRDGLVGAYQWTPQEQYGVDVTDCSKNGEMSRPQGKDLLPGYPAIQGDEALIWFQSSVALPLKKVKVTRRIGGEWIPAEPLVDPSPGGVGTVAHIRVTVNEVDLDNDGVADLVQWDFGRVLDEDENNDFPIQRTTYININGNWYSFGEEHPYDCGMC